MDVPTDQAQPAGGRKLILARTDQDVAWRGDTNPDDPAHLVRKLLGKKIDLISEWAEMTKARSNIVVRPAKPIAVCADLNRLGMTR